MTVPVQIYDSVSGAQEGSPAQGSAAELRLTRTNDAALAPGRFVTRDGHDRKVKVPTSVAEVLACSGIAELSVSQILSSNTSGNYPINTRLSVVRKGVIWMVAVTAATQGQDVFVYYGTGDTALRGKCGGSFSSGENYKLPGAKFATTQATPGSLVAVEVDLPSGSAENAPGVQNIAFAVHYESTGTTWDFVGGVQPSGVTITDTGVGTFRLTVAGATQVLPLGQPVLKLATPLAAGATGGVAKAVQVIAIAATTIEFAVQSQQADDQLFDVLDLADNDIVYGALQVTY